MRRPLPRRPLSARRSLGALALACAATAGWAQERPTGPERARVEQVEGSAAVSSAGEREWTDAAWRTLRRGDRLWVDPGSRIEVKLGGDLLRLQGPAHLQLTEHHAGASQLSLTQGTMQAQVRGLPAGRHFDINTPNLAFRAGQPGEYRVDVDRVRSTTQVTVLAGDGTVYGSGGQKLALTAGQQLAFSGQVLARAELTPGTAGDAFARWVQRRERPVGQARASQPAPAGVAPAPARNAPAVVDARVNRPAPPPPTDAVRAAVKPPAPSVTPQPALRPAKPPAAPAQTQARAPSRPATSVMGAAPASVARPVAGGPRGQLLPAATATRLEEARREAWHREQAALSEKWRREDRTYRQRHPEVRSQGIPILREVGRQVAGRP